jgi:putative molybdopterin biosynthesis protein
MAEESFLTAEQLADRLNITKTTVYRLVRRGDLRGYLVGRALRFDPEDVRAYLARVQLTVRPTASARPARRCQHERGNLFDSGRPD